MSGKCDFCSKIDPEWIYPSNEFDLPEDGWGSRGAWAACEACAELIEHGKDRQLALKSVRSSDELRGLVALGVLSRVERRAVLTHVIKLHARFRAARRGPRRLFG